MARTGGTSNVAAVEGCLSNVCEMYAKKEVAKRKSSKAKSSESADLASLIESELIPRLLLAYSSASAERTTSRRASTRHCGPSDVALLTSLVLSMDGNAGTELIDRLLREGAAIEELLLNLLAPVARRLGDMWDADQADFLTVTSAVCELQRILHRLAPSHNSATAEEGPHALLMPAPGEQHSFGLLIVAEMFRRDGWGVTTNTPSQLSDISRAVKRYPYEIVGFSLSSELLIEALFSAIRVVKSDSRVAGTRIIVGGNAFVSDPGLCRKVGADFHATDANHAMIFARAVAVAR